MTNPTRRLVKALAWCLALVLGLLVWSTVARVTYGGPPEADRLGSATSTTCTEHGPVGLRGFGTSYTCQAEVRWSDGETEVAEFPAGQLRPGKRDVPVYLDTAESGRAETTLGRNDTAKYSAVRLPAVLGLGFLVVVLALGAGIAVYRVFRPDEAEQAKRGEWPVSRAEVKAVRIPRLQLLAGWFVFAVAYTVLATIPRYDAPRGEGTFTSPWPQIERALLVDPPATGVVIIGLILAVLVWVIHSTVRADAARVRRYGPAFLARDQRKKPERPKRGAADLGFGLVLLAVALWGTIRVFTSGIADAPLTVWLASARDAVLFACLGALWLGTGETAHQRIARLLAEHQERSGSGGTAGGAATS
ncbi:DUF6346 domain-containing protein [Amycolatopsis magusensis]|uniref:DUF3592 domain-containing protein n=1 Tax=Amycolatopsis magusensis TaxID=882444 RepID=A0ABS4PSC8_9PSEU|nr:DUF6346 domain-containing protein [Amycolatopsis magusensis]MBP2181511.1 hypothetical protein [Amycolatopsis magusensis]